MKRYKPNQFSSSSVERKTRKNTAQIAVLNPNSAGIDIGSRSHFVAVPPERCQNNVREFSSVTNGVLSMAEWLLDCGITTVAMESTGSYWIPVYEILESKGLEVYLVNAHMVKNVPGRKTDVLDCQWIQKLHSFGLLNKSFRPKDQCLKLRSLTRQHSSLIQHRSPHILHMQKALCEMNIQLSTHIRDITGVTGRRIVDAIIAGERDLKVFASLVHPTCKNSPKKIAESLIGNYRPEHLFALKQAQELYDFYSVKILECEVEISNALNMLVLASTSWEQQTNEGSFQINERFIEEPIKQPSRKSKKEKKEIMLVTPMLKAISGVDLTSSPGIDQPTALKILAELGAEVTAWPSSKHFASWLGLCPGNKVSGGRQLTGKTKPCANRVANLLRMAVNGLWNSKSYLGAYLRRMKARLGGMKAITCAAHKLATIIYNMIKNKTSYEDLGEEYYEKTYNERRLKGLRRQASEMGLQLVPVTPAE